MGELVKTIPLAPKGVRRFSHKTTIKKSRAEREVESSVHSRRSDSSETSRAETEILRKAQARTNFSLGAEGGLNLGVAEVSASTQFEHSAASSSQETKKTFREAVFKASEEYRAERKLEVNVSASEEMALEESGEINNPNDEITVTYLFYELQRRYRVSEKIHRVNPVVLVAQEVPRPNETDEDWIVAHDWILRRVILDDSFLPAMDYLITKVVGDEVALQEMFQNLEQQRRLLEELKDELVAIREQSGRRYAALQRAITQRAAAVEAEEDEGFLESTHNFFFGGDASVSPETRQILEESARDAYERAAKEEKVLQARLERESTALATSTDEYTRKLSAHLNRKAQIARLRVHIKSNILYYMQAIWSHEPPDQRFFRLHNVQVPRMSGELKYTLVEDPDAMPVPPDWKKPLKLVTKGKFDSNFGGFETLEEAADLDNLLGFKGNYMLFPLKRSNLLTDFMMTPYLDPVAGLRDPDPLGDWTLQEFAHYVCCLRENLSDEEFDELRPGLEETRRRISNAPSREEEILVPTNSLFIETLPGKHPILEDYKLYHRVMDVKKAQAQVRAQELDNVRAAALPKALQPGLRARRPWHPSAPSPLSLAEKATKEVLPQTGDREGALRTVGHEGLQALPAPGYRHSPPRLLLVTAGEGHNKAPGPHHRVSRLGQP